MSRSKKIALRTDYVVENSTTIQTTQQEAPGNDLAVRLIDRGEFIALFESKRESLTSGTELDASEFWDTLMGNEHGDTDANQNPNVHYLTEESACLLIENNQLFISGIDFYNLPKGFMLIKNPFQNGLRNVLHYSAYLAKIDKKNRALAIDLSDKIYDEAPNVDHGFPPPQDEWYAFLREKMTSDNKIFCTEDELKKAFITFIGTINNLNLEFYSPNFHEDYSDSEYNPIVLLGRWNALLTQPHLKPADVQAQWQALPSLYLINGYSAIRAISDYQNTLTPCGFVLPEMFSIFSTEYSFINTVHTAKAIRNLATFWRYIAYQPKRNSIDFYRRAIDAIYSMDIHNERKIQLICILAGSTTGRTHDAKTSEEEEIELTVWTSLCTLIDTVTDATPTLQFYTFVMGGPHAIKNDYVVHLHRLNEYPNIPMLRSVARTISMHLENLSVTGIVANGAMLRHPLQDLLTLSDKINILTERYGTTFYEGAKFWFVDREWQTVSLTQYIEMQYTLLEANAIASALLAPYLSTFRLDPEWTLLLIGNDSFATLTPSEMRNLQYILHFFRDATQQKTLDDLRTIFTYVKTVPQVEGELIPILDWVTVNFRDSFSEGYLEKRRQHLVDAQYGLNDAQKQFILNLHFPDVQTQALFSIESALLIKNNNITNNELEELNDCLVQFSRVFTETDVSDFLCRIESLRDNLSGSTRPLIDLLNLLISRKSLEGFNQIYFCNKIEKCTDTSLIHKFIVYIDALKPKGNKLGDISALDVQNLLATITLNCDVDRFFSQDFFDAIDGILKVIEIIGTTQPHIARYVLELYNHIGNKNTNSYLQTASDISRCIEELALLLKSGMDDIAQNDMLSFYALMANFHKHPNDLMQIWEKIKLLADPHLQKFIINLINSYKENHLSLNGLDALIDSLSQDQSKHSIIATFCTHPPYPSLKLVYIWLTNNTFEENYKTFSMRPFGKRNLEFAFKPYEFSKQKSKFIGVNEEIFTEDLAESIHAQLKINRQRSTEDLRSAFAALSMVNVPITDEQKVTLLCICIEMLSRTTWQLSHTGSNVISQEVNTTQVMALYTMLMVPNNKIINEIDTGEGKSRIMMIMAALKVAQGKTVDFLTGDMQLAERDFLAYGAFFKSLDIRTSLISLDTPKQLYQKGGVNFTDNGQLLLLRNKSDIDGEPYAYLDEEPGNRCLLLDECDKFMHDKSQDSFNYANYDERLKKFTWVYPLLVAFVKSTLEHNPDLKFDATTLTDAFIDYVATNQLDMERVADIEKAKNEDENQVITWLNSAYTALHMKVDDDCKVTESTDDKLYCVRDVDGLIHYTRKVLVLDTGRIVDKSTFADGIHQSLCALENKKTGREDFVILPENVTQRAMYPVSFMAKYHQGNIIGATGTSRRDAPASDTDINYEEYAYIKVPRQKTLRRQDKNVWLANGVEQQFEFIKKCMMDKLSQIPQGAILLICKNDQQSEQLYQRIQNDTTLRTLLQSSTRVQALTEKHDEVKAVREAGLPGYLTVSTAGMFSRGVDIQASDLLVLSAYVPTIEDEIQIKGRTGRFGKEGEYRMIPDMLDPDCPINGFTYNVHNEIDTIQKQMAVSAVDLEEISKLYAEFLEHIHQAFLAKPMLLQSKDYLMEWQKYLGAMQKDWNYQKDPLLDAIELGDQNEFIELFNNFTNKWEYKAAAFIKEFEVNEGAMNDRAHVVYKALEKQQGFFNHKPLPIKVQRNYDIADDGQARIYSTLFAQELAFLKGERDLFANYKAYKQGRGVLFPDLKATLNGERPLFSNLRATIERILEIIARWLKSPEPEQEVTDEDEFYAASSATNS